MLCVLNIWSQNEPIFILLIKRLVLNQTETAFHVSNKKVPRIECQIGISLIIQNDKKKRSSQLCLCDLFAEQKIAFVVLLITLSELFGVAYF